MNAARGILLLVMSFVLGYLTNEPLDGQADEGWSVRKITPMTFQIEGSDVVHEFGDYEECEAITALVTEAGASGDCIINLSQIER